MDEFDTVVSEAPAEFQAAETVEAEEGFPSFFYGSDGPVLCHSKADVPAGFKDHPSKVPGAPDPSLVVSERRLPRAELMTILKARGIDFKQTMGGGQLAKLVADSDEKEAAKAKMAHVRAAIKPKVKKPSKAARSGKK